MSYSGILATIYNMSGFKSAAMIFASTKAKKAKDIFNKKFLLLV